MKIINLTFITLCVMMLSLFSVPSLIAGEHGGTALKQAAKEHGGEEVEEVMGKHKHGGEEVKKKVEEHVGEEHGGTEVVKEVKEHGGF